MTCMIDPIRHRDFYLCRLGHKSLSGIFLLRGRAEAVSSVAAVLVLVFMLQILSLACPTLAMARLPAEQSQCGWERPRDDLPNRADGEPMSGSPMPGWTAPADLRAARTSWGDVTLSWTVDGDAAHRYRIEIIAPSDQDLVLRRIDVDTPHVVGGRVVVDYPVEMNVPDFGFPPTWLHWRVSGDCVITHSMAADIPIDNAGIVKRAIMFSGQSNAVGHFTELSGSSRGNVSAATLRRRVADLAGLRDVEVMPVNAAWGSAAADRWADDDPMGGVNHWWDLDADLPGPRALEAVEIARGLGVPIAALIWAQGENDASAFDPLAAPRHSSPERYRAATERVFAYMREQLGQPDLPIWIQTLGRSYWGNSRDALIEVSGPTFKATRDQQRAIANTDPNVMIGSWLPDAGGPSGYIPEAASPGWIHYTSAVYHAAALELADSLGSGIDRINSPPQWAIADMPKGIRADRTAAGDIVMSWDNIPGATWRVRNISVADARIISERTVNDPHITFTRDDQVSIYGHVADYVSVEIAQALGYVSGPSSTYVGKVGDAEAAQEK